MDIYDEYKTYSYREQNILVTKRYYREKSSAGFYDINDDLKWRLITLQSYFLPQSNSVIPNIFFSLELFVRNN